MRNTLQYVLKKLLLMIPMVLVITFLIYWGLDLTPGDPISYMFSPDQLANIDPQKLAEMRELYGLNDPFFLRYLKWLWQLLQGNFGYSITNGVAIKDLLAQLFPATLELSLAALFISTILGSVLGILSALKKGSLGDNLLTVAGMIGVSIPQFFFGMVCIVVFALNLGWLPIGGRTAPGMTGAFAHLKFLILPASVLGISLTAGVMRQSGAWIPCLAHASGGSDRIPSADADRRFGGYRDDLPVARHRQCVQNGCYRPELSVGHDDCAVLGARGADGEFPGGYPDGNPRPACQIGIRRAQT